MRRVLITLVTWFQTQIDSIFVNQLINKSIKMAYSTIITAVVLVIFVFIAYRQLEERQRCKMTVMWYYPMFTHVPISTETDVEFPHYRLVVYGEAKYHESLERGEFNGAPVLFLPGNGGKHRQVRSLGSVSFMKTVNRMRNNESMLEFNYFALDFDEEFSALSSQLLRQQTEFARRAVIKIMELYKDNENVKQLIIIGHSMGGVIGRRLLKDNLPISILLTLATPHLPLLPYDYGMKKYYDEINDPTVVSSNDSSTDQPLIISIAGGSHDVLVPVEYTQLPITENVISVISPYIPHVWSSSDHLCIVWCNQLTTMTARALFDMLDRTNGQVIYDSSTRERIIKRHFIHQTVVRNVIDEVDFQPINIEDTRIDTVSMTQSTVPMAINISATIEERTDTNRIARLISTNEEMVIYTDRYADDVVQTCIQDECHPADVDHAVLDDYWHMYRLAESSNYHIIVHDNTDARRYNTSLTFIRQLRVEYRQIMTKWWEWLYSEGQFEISSDHHTIVQLNGYSESITRALTIDVEGLGCQDTTVAWLSVDDCDSRTPNRLQSTYINNGTHDRLHVHHHSRSTAHGRDICATVVPTPFSNCTTLRVIYSSSLLKGIYVTMQMNAFGVRYTYIAGIVVIAIALLTRTPLSVQLTITTALVIMLSMQNEEIIVITIVCGMLYISVAVILSAILHMILLIRSHPFFVTRLVFECDNKSKVLLWLVALFSTLICGWLSFALFFVYCVIKTRVPSLSRIASLICIALNVVLLLPSAFLAHHSIIQHFTLPVEDSSLYSGLLLMVMLIIRSKCWSPRTAVLTGLLTMACLLIMTQNTWTLTALIITPAIAMMIDKEELRV